MNDFPEPLLSTSAGHIFQLFRQGRVRTRRELMHLTGLSRSTVMQRLDALLGAVCSDLAALLKKSRRDPASVCGIGIGVPGPVDVIAGHAVQPPIMPGWDRFPVRDAVARHFPAPTFLENDANLMALGESALCYPDIHSLLFVKVATGIGAGLVIAGRVYDGVDGGAGDIGHVRIAAAEHHRCSCGAEGCLAAVASGGAIARQLKEQGWPTETSRDVVRLF